MLPVTSSAYSSRRDNSVLATAIKQLKRRFGRKLRRAFRKRRLVFVGLTCLVLISWWILRTFQSQPTANPMQHVSEEALFPVKIQQLNVEIEDIDTDVLLCGYSDYVLVTVTQTESFGTIFQCRTDTNLDGATSFNIRVLVGNRTNELLMLCARQLAESLLAAGCSKPLILCLGLRELSLLKVRQVVHQVVQHPVW